MRVSIPNHHFCEFSTSLKKFRKPSNIHEIRELLSVIDGSHVLNELHDLVAVTPLVANRLFQPVR